MTKARINYTKEFKLAILSQVESGIPVAQVAHENGLHSGLGYLSPIEIEPVRESNAWIGIIIFLISFVVIIIIHRVYK